MSFESWTKPMYGIAVNINKYNIDKTRTYIEENLDAIKAAWKGTACPLDPLPESNDDLAAILSDYENDNGDQFGIAQIIVDVIHETEDNKDLAQELCAMQETDGCSIVYIGVEPMYVYPWSNVYSVPSFFIDELEDVVNDHLKACFDTKNITDDWDYQTLHFFG